LSRYDDVDIAQIPAAGDALQSFFRRYYQFEEAIAALEQEALKRIGARVAVRFAEGWRIYLRYGLLRFIGHSDEQSSAGNSFLNYDVTWAEAERVYGDLAKDPALARGFANVFAQQNAFRQDVEALRRLVPAAR